MAVVTREGKSASSSVILCPGAASFWVEEDSPGEDDKIQVSLQKAIFHSGLHGMKGKLETKLVYFFRIETTTKECKIFHACGG